MDSALLSLEEQYNLPLTQELIDEVDRLRAQLSGGTKIPDSQIEGITVPHIFEHKLLMKEGEYNGVFYPKDSILEAVDDADEKGLVFDHLDTTQGEGASNWLGHITNPLWDENGEDGPGLYGDLKVVDKACAQTLASGAKWGISPAIDYQKNEIDGKVIGTDLLWKSFSFVLSPAVRETMLNNLKKQKKGDLNMEAAKVDLANEGDKKYPYVKPGKVDPKKKIKDEEELMVDDAANTALQARDKKIMELTEFKDKVELSEKTKKIAELVANEFLIGRLSAEELADREKTLLEKSPEVLSELSEIIGSHAELSKFTAFVNAFTKTHKDATLEQAAKTWNKQNLKGKSKLSETPAVDPNIPGAGLPPVAQPGNAPAQPSDLEKGDEATDEPIDDVEGNADPASDPAADNLGGKPDANANTATLTGHNSPAPGRGLAELREKGLGISDEDKAMYAFLIDNGGR